MSSYRYGRPALKSTVDVQLQTAFSDGNWSSVVRLATKRAATLKDPYYEVCYHILAKNRIKNSSSLQAIKMCAQSQLDGTLEKCAMLVAIDDLVKTKKTPDIDTIELYEWACRDFFDYEVEFADTLGPLRARWAKANPGSPLALQCLQSCLENWDLVSAQQVGLPSSTPASPLANLRQDIDKSGQGIRQHIRPPVHVLEHYPYLSPLSVCPVRSSKRHPDTNRSVPNAPMPAARSTAC